MSASVPKPALPPPWGFWVAFQASRSARSSLRCAAEIDSFGDHRIAMAFAIAGLFASGETVIRNTECVNTSYPGFAHHLDAIRGEKTLPADFMLPTSCPS